VEEIGAGYGAERGCYGAEVMADEAFCASVAEGVDEGDGVFYEVHGAEGGRVEGFGEGDVVGAAVSALVECDDVVASGGEEGDYVAPAVGEFGEAVDEEDEGTAMFSCFEDVEFEAMRGGVDEARFYA
jgi:hypothetical protein